AAELSGARADEAIRIGQEGERALGQTVGRDARHRELSDRTGRGARGALRPGHGPRRRRNIHGDITPVARPRRLEPGLRIAQRKLRARPGSRPFTAVEPWCRAQFAQQKMPTGVSTPWPMIRQLQCAQVGASAWMAHSKLSNTCVSLPRVTWNALS